jgi:NhaP-type Na+/H+ or K+/H+ antiporter
MSDDDPLMDYRELLIKSKLRGRSLKWLLVYLALAAPLIGGSFYFLQHVGAPWWIAPGGVVVGMLLIFAWLRSDVSFPRAKWVRILGFMAFYLLVSFAAALLSPHRDLSVRIAIILALGAGGILAIITFFYSPPDPPSSR